MTGTDPQTPPTDHPIVVDEEVRRAFEIVERGARARLALQEQVASLAEAAREIDDEFPALPIDVRRITSHVIAATISDLVRIIDLAQTAIVTAIVAGRDRPGDQLTRAQLADALGIDPRNLERHKLVRKASEI
jgi:hypothetical protein